MMFLRKALALVGLLATGSLAAVAGLKSRQTEPSNFKLYAYGGDEVGGYEIFYADGAFALLSHISSNAQPL